MSLPFWDDFSTPANTDTLWSHKESVWINNGMGKNAPTVGVATFDGLNGDGIPYSPNPNQNLDFGLTDSLLSRPIKMTEVPVFERNTVFLSFFYQWGGFGEIPDQNDFLRLEFLNTEGNWMPVLTLYSNQSQSPGEFYGHSIRINQDQYYHDAFQFRFRSSGRQSGRYDTWNIDYVYMDKGRTENDLQNGFPDRAPTRLLTSLFKEYYAVPQTHFITDIPENTAFPTYAIRNLDNIIQPMSYNVEAHVVTWSDGASNPQNFPVVAAEEILPSLTGFEKRDLPFVSKPDLSLVAGADSTFITIKTTLNSDDCTDGAKPLNFCMNDTIRQHYSLKDYYAYDDGVAEYAVGLTQTGNQAAYRFVVKTGEPDTLNGVYVYFPVTAGSAPSTVMFMVWRNDNGKPGALVLEELVPVQRRGNNEFVERAFIQSVIVQDTFFIGWRQPQIQAGRVQIGLDASQNTNQHLFENITGSWVPVTRLEGSLMIRPRFGTGTVITSIETKPTALSIYPNPHTGSFVVKGNYTELQLFALTGQPVSFDTEAMDEEHHIRMHNPTPGLYILRYRIGNQVFSEKMIVHR